MTNKELDFIDEYEKLCKKYEMIIDQDEFNIIIRTYSSDEELDSYIGILKKEG